VPSLDGHEYRARAEQKCDYKAPPTPTPRPQPTPAPVHEREVWLEDAASAAAKLEIANRHQMGGIGAWRLGQEDPGVWPHLREYRSTR
jgi:hypothetical protein